jgi:hypothetical protein
MANLIKHKWIKIGFKAFRCENCGCEKSTIADYLYPLYVVNGRMQTERPECKTVFHNDKIQYNAQSIIR